MSSVFLEQGFAFRQWEHGAENYLLFDSFATGESAGMVCGGWGMEFGHCQGRPGPSAWMFEEQGGDWTLFSFLK